MDPSKLDMTKKGIERKDMDFAIAWIHRYGKGCVFHSTFGHTEESRSRANVRKMCLEAAKRCMGLTEADSTPRARRAN